MKQKHWFLACSLFAACMILSVRVTDCRAKEKPTMPVAGISQQLSGYLSDTDASIVSVNKEKTTKQQEKETTQRVSPFAKETNVPNHEAGCKSYKKTHMSYTAITDVHSPQYALQQDAYTGPRYGIRMYEDCFMVAVGTYYADSIGQHILVTMESGEVIECVVGDFKADKHTDATHRYHTGGYENGVYYEGDGSVLEFIVDTTVYRPEQQPEVFAGDIYRIEKVKD